MHEFKCKNAHCGKYKREMPRPKRHLGRVRQIYQMELQNVSVLLITKQFHDVIKMLMWAFL